MARPRQIYQCKDCGTTSPKWLGRCPKCEAWSSFEEEVFLPPQAQTLSNERAELCLEFSDWREKARSEVVSGQGNTPIQPNINALNLLVEEEVPRWSTGLSELDRVLGGGLTRDSFTLLGGDPGIGKSTLLLQMAGALAKQEPTLTILYVSGEESVSQIRNRSLRLGMQVSTRLSIAAETQLERVFQLVKEYKPSILLMDSLQTFATQAVSAPPGSSAQVRELASRLMNLAKLAGIAVWLVGHVTKEGAIAGPKTVEHLVDTVLYFEGEAGLSHRLLRAVKNRFGSTHELGVFEMGSEGLREVSNPSALFLSEREQAVSGTAVTAVLEGSRPILVELQALVTPSGLAMPRRTSVGIDSTRISLLAAILEKHLRLALAQHDLFFNVAGGLRLSEPASDFAAAAAIWSSFRNHPLPIKSLFLGELGLTGELRRIPQVELRIQEAQRLGFERFFLPKLSSPREQEDIKRWKAEGMQVQVLGKIQDFPGLFS